SDHPPTVRPVVAAMRHVLVTGGSSGIGLAIASILLSRGERVTLLARDGARLAAAATSLAAEAGGPERIHTVQADVTDAASVAAAGPVEALVASAGIVEPALFDAQPAVDFERQIAVNLLGVANSVRAVLPAMYGKGSGRVAIVSSGAGLIGIPGYSAYCASKF